MATPEKLLSTKNAEKADKLDANKEDKAVKEVGGPESDWTTANYANFKFDAAVGVSPDTTILSKAKVKAQKPESLKEGEKCPNCDSNPCVCESLDEVKDDEKSEEEVEESFLTAAKDEDAAEESAEEIPADDEDKSDDDSLELDLSDLVDEDEDVVELTPEDDVASQDDAAGEDVPVDDDAADMDMDEAHGEFAPSDDDMMWSDDDEDKEIEVEAKTDEVEEVEPEEAESESDEDASEDEEEKHDEMEEDKAVALTMGESKFRISFKTNEIGKLFENNTVLTEDDKRQSRALFESAIRTVAKDMSKQLQEAYQARYATAKKQYAEKMSKQVDAYLSYVVEQWVKDNKVALQHQLRNRLTESFIGGFKKLCTDHYIDVPQSKVNVVEALAKNVKSLKSKLKETEAQNVKLHESAQEAIKRERIALRKEHKARLIAEAAAAVTAADRGEFKNRAETVKFTTTKEFKKNLIALREQYFVATKSVERPTNEPVAEPLFESTRRPVTPVDVYTQIADKWTKQS